MNNNWVPNKCTCIPSGMCHSMTLLGCPKQKTAEQFSFSSAPKVPSASGPHKHYFNEKN